MPKGTQNKPKSVAPTAAGIPIVHNYLTENLNPYLQEKPTALRKLAWEQTDYINDHFEMISFAEIRSQQTIPKKQD